MKLQFPSAGAFGITELLTISACAGAVFLTFSFYNTRILPNTTINSVPVGGLTIEEAAPRVQAAQIVLPQQDVVVSVDNVSIASNSSQLGFDYDYDTALLIAFTEGKQGSIPQRFFAIISRLWRPKRMVIEPQFDQSKLTEMVALLQQRVDLAGVQPEAKLGTSGNAATLQISRGEPGRALDLNATLALVEQRALRDEFMTQAQVASTSAELTDDQLALARERAERFVGQSVVFEDEHDPQLTRTLSDQELVSMLLFPVSYDKTRISQLMQGWAQTINRPAQDAVLEYDPQTLKVTTFTPDKPGLQLDEKQMMESVIRALNDIDKGLINQEKATVDPEQETASGSAKLAETQPPTPLLRPLIIAKTAPSRTLEQTNDLGIREQIGYGESEYEHSIPNRVHNVAITAERISNTIVPAGAEFSFNKTLGEVSARTGYKSAYVIRNGRTELGDGGGVCQVSTTVFRAALNAGLPITKRIPHSYRVSYYELDSKPGIDATVYAGNIDLRFKNDTNHAILIHTQTDSKALTMHVQLYGTSDGRTAEIKDHITWDYRAPPPAQYFPDPTLPTGVKKQIDWSAAGIKAKFTNVVRDSSGAVIREEVYTSNYKPWAAKYLVGQ